MTTVAEKPLCEGCLDELDVFSLVGGYSVCMDCTKARHKAVLKRKCCCGRKKRERDTPCKVGSRVWFTCLRCLGTTRQVS